MRAFIPTVFLSLALPWGSAPAQNAPSALESTLDLKEKFRHGISLLWSPCGQAAWDEMRAYYHVDKIEMTPRSHTAEVLNAFQWDRDKTLPDGTVIFGGDDSEAFRRRIRDDLRKRCGANAADIIGPYEPPGPVSEDGKIRRIKTAIFVSAFARALRFPGSFTDDATPKTFLATSGRASKSYGFGTFGAQSESYGDSVRVLEDDLKGGFCLRLNLFSENRDHPECLVLLRDAALHNLEEAVLRMRKLLKQERQPQRTVESGGQKLLYQDTLETNDILWLPELHAALATDFRDLVGKRFLSKSTLENGLKTDWWWEIREAQQLLNFRLNHQGALAQAVFKIPADFLSSTGAEASATPARPSSHYRKTFIFDKPFIASFWREGADYPYLACWVDGPEMLVEKK